MFYSSDSAKQIKVFSPYNWLNCFIISHNLFRVVDTFIRVEADVSFICGLLQWLVHLGFLSGVFYYLLCSRSIINRDLWLSDAQACDKSEHVQTCQAIVREVIGIGVEDEDRRETWLEDAESFVRNEAYNAARAVYAHCLTVFPADEELWEQVAFFEKEHGTRESLDAHLRKAVKYCPQAETLWLMGAKSAWLGGNVDAARSILSHAFTANPNSEDIWLAAVKLESENNMHERARKLLENARGQAGTARVWMKSVRLEWVLGNLEGAANMLAEAVKLHPTAPKLWMMRGQISEQLQQTENAREYYSQGIKHCQNSIHLWVLAARLEVKTGKSLCSILFHKN